MKLTPVLPSLIQGGEVFHCSAALIELTLKFVALNPTHQSPLVDNLEDLVPFLELVTKSLSGGWARSLRIL